MKKYEHEQKSIPRFNEANGFYTTEQRSAIMKKIKSTDTKPEAKLRKALWQLGYRYRKNWKKLPGSPDIALLRYKVVIFVDGEFWHGFNWEVKKDKIKSNRGFWLPKIERNMQRDQQVNEKLREVGWTVLRFWEQEIKKDFDKCIRRIVECLSALESKGQPTNTSVKSPEK